MADETTVSTPAESSASETSADERTDVQTSEVESQADTQAADNNVENVQEGDESASAKKLYAGKYESTEELEKGYLEAQKFVSKASEFEKKYNELLAQKENEFQKAYEARQQEARARGFMSADEAEIADKVQLAEFEYYAQNLNQVAPEVSEQARQYLLAYYQTGHNQYLDEAKKLFNPSFIENVAQAKANYLYQLQAEKKQIAEQKRNTEEKKLADMIKTEFKEFLGDLSENEGKSTALRSFCDAGFINSQEDMQAFCNIYSKIAEHERTQAIKEYEAQKAIEATKEKAAIESTPAQLGGNKASYTVADVANMTQKEFDDYCAKHGTDWLYK